MINKRNKKDKQKETNTMILDHVCIFIAVIIEYCVFEQ